MVQLHAGSMTEDEEIEQLTDEVLCERLQDAVLALEEIQQGRAKGFRIPLKGRAMVESCFYYISRLLVLYPPFVSLAVLTGVVVLFSVFATGFVFVEVETNEEKLWVESEGRLNEEIGYTERYLPKDNVSTTEILIQTVMGRNFTISMMDHLRLLLSIKKIVVERGNKCVCVYVGVGVGVDVWRMGVFVYICIHRYTITPYFSHAIFPVGIIHLMICVLRSHSRPLIFLFWTSC